MHVWRWRGFTFYRDPDDLWVGAYRGPHHWYICPLPTLVIRVERAHCGDPTCTEAHP